MPKFIVIPSKETEGEIQERDERVEEVMEWCFEKGTSKSGRCIDNLGDDKIYTGFKRSINFVMNIKIAYDNLLFEKERIPLFIKRVNFMIR